MLNVVDVTIMLTSSKNFLGLLVLDDVVSDSYEIKKKLSEKIYDEGGWDPTVRMHRLTRDDLLGLGGLGCIQSVCWRRLGYNQAVCRSQMREPRLRCIELNTSHPSGWDYSPSITLGCEGESAVGWVGWRSITCSLVGVASTIFFVSEEVGFEERVAEREDEVLLEDVSSSLDGLRTFFILPITPGLDCSWLSVVIFDEGGGWGNNQRFETEESMSFMRSISCLRLYHEWKEFLGTGRQTRSLWEAGQGGEVERWEVKLIW